jgi:ATP-dependent protease ClpP protease subunit
MDDDLISIIGGGSDFIKTNKMEIKIHHVFFDDEIGEPKDYRDLRNLLYTADQNDKFIFFINCIGGQLYTTLGIIEAMRRSDAEIHSIIEGECMSAATLLMLSSDSIEVTDSAIIMCHSASFGLSGNVSGVKRQADFTEKQWKKLEQETYTGFLTPAEMSDMAKGLELYYNADDARVRLKKWSQLKNKATKKVD